MQKLIQRPHKYSFTWTQPNLKGSSRSFIVQQSTIPQANWGVFAGTDLKADDDLIIGDDPKKLYALDDVHAKFGDRIFLQNPDDPRADFSAAGEQKARELHQGSWASFSVLAMDESDFDVKMERALKLRWISRVRDWNRAARASKLSIQELSYNNGVDPYVLSTTPIKTNQTSNGRGNRWMVDIYDPFNSPMGFLNHPLRAEYQNVSFMSDSNTARMKTLKPVKAGEELFWSYGDAYVMDPAPDIEHFHLGREAVTDAMLGAPLTVGTGKADADLYFYYPDKRSFDSGNPNIDQTINNGDGSPAFYALKCAWEPYWTLNDWVGIGQTPDVAWDYKGIRKLMQGFNAMSKNDPYEHFKHVVENFFGGTKTALPRQKLKECLAQFRISTVARESLGLKPQAFFGAQVVKNEKGQNIIGCSVQYAHNEGGDIAAELFFYFEQILPPSPSPEAFLPPTPDNMIVEDEKEDNIVLRRDLRDYSKDVAALMEHLRDPKTSFRGQKLWHDVLIEQKMVDRHFYPRDNAGFSLWRKHTGDISLTKNTQHLYSDWLAFRWDQSPGKSVHFVVNLKDKWNGGVRPYVFGGKNAVERLVPEHETRFFLEFMQRHQRVRRLVEDQNRIVPHYLDVVKNLEAPVWVSLVLKGVVDPKLVNSFATTDYIQKWGEEEYEKAVLEIAVEQSLVKLPLPVKEPVGEDRLFWREHPDQKRRRDKQKRIALKFGWRQGTLDERRRGIQKIVVHQKCLEKSQEKGVYVTHTKFARTLPPFKK